MNIKACFASGNTAMGIIGNRKNSKDAPLLKDLIKDTLPSIEEDEEEEKKPWRQENLNWGPLDYETVALTTSPPPLPTFLKS